MSRRRRNVLLVSGTVSALLLGGTSALAAPPAPLTPHHLQREAPRVVSGSASHNPLLKQVLSQSDPDKGTEAPNISAQCQQFAGKQNPYNATGADVDMIVNDNVQSAGSSAGCYTPQNETTIATNPENPANLVAGANDYRVYNSRENRNDSSGYAYTSMDGGRTWKEVELPGLTYQTGAVGALRAMDGAGDPIVSFGPDNTVYYGNIVFSRGTPVGIGTEAPSAIVVNVSHDGGLTFGKPTIVQLDGADSAGNTTPTRVFNDKIWLAGDPHSKRVYVTWSRFLDTKDGGYRESPIVESVSDDEGKTFSPYTRIDPQLGAETPGLEPFSQGSNPQVAPDGTLYVAYETSDCATQACDQPGDHDVVVVATSKDHGKTFTRSIVGTDYDFPFSEQAEDTALTDENFRVNSFPQLTVDARTSQLLLTWNDDRNGSYDASGESVRTNGDNIVTSSTNGADWTTPVAVGSAQDEVFGAIASYNGKAAVASYTRQYRRTNVQLDFAYWPLTAKPGRTVTAGPAVRLTTQSSDPRVQFPFVDDDGNVQQGAFIGDYNAMSIGTNGVLHPAWTDFRGNPGTTTPNQDAYTRAVPLR